jgi:hypothetical protein
MGALVGQCRLRTDEHDLTTKTGIPETSRDGVPGRTAADYQRSFDCFRTRRSDHTRYPPSTAMANA